MHKFIRVNDFLHKAPENTDPPNGYEVGAEIADDSRVIVGVSIRAEPGSITTMVLGGRRLDPATGELVGDVIHLFAGTQPNHPLERELTPNNVPDGSNRVLGGLWTRAEPGSVTSMTLWTKSINDIGVLDGLLAVPTGSVPQPPNGFEAEKILPSPFVLVSFALRAQPGSVTHIKGLYSRLAATQ